MARNIFFVSDTHYGEHDIIKYTGRPFDSVTDMDNTLIENWNELVGPKDIVYHLGDFTSGGPEAATHYFKQLNGIIRVLGNHWHHDKLWLPKGFGKTPYLSKTGSLVEVLPPMVVLEFPRKESRYPQIVVLSHYPLTVWEKRQYGSIHLHGHTHGGLRTPSLCFDVGVDSDMMEYTPITLEEILELNSLPILIREAAET